MQNLQEFKYENTQYQTWEAVFANPCAIKIETVNTGFINCKVTGLIDGGHQQYKTAKIPVLAHIITHNVKGNFLVDAGFDSTFSKVVGGSFKGILKKVFFKNHYCQNSLEDGIDNQTRHLKLNTLFLTHMHEHAAGASALPNGLSVVVGKGEREVNVFPLIFSKFLSGKSVYSLDFSKAMEMPILGKCIDIFGDGSFFAIATPGHTVGHVSYLINGLDGPILLTGDACITKLGFDLELQPGTFSKYKKQGQVSFDNLVEFAKAYPNVRLVFGHESEQFLVEYFA